eukprot:s604_g2.t1
MSWSLRDFEGERGVSLLLQRFASSPLVRRSLPNAAAIMAEYFGFKRRPQEAIGTFLVRETSGFEEFSEALLQLKEEKDGVDPANRVFDLPDITPESDDDDWHWRGRGDWRQWQNWNETQSEDPDRPDRSDYEQVPQQSEHGSETKVTAGSPKGPGPSSPSRSPPSQRQVDESPKPDTGVLSAMDSFILDVLRGWRLLVAASLSPDEWRDVLATTGNKLDYLSVSAALQTLWDDQLSGSGKWHGAQQAAHTGYWSEAAWPAEPWQESYLAWNDWNDDENYDWWQGAGEVQSSELPAPITDDKELDMDPALAEALEAEKAAEGLAMEARRTWSQAQAATQQLRRDRGFGKGVSPSTSPSVRCYICNGPHLQKDCPDRQHPSYRKGYGKSLSPAELDAFLSGKSKGKMGSHHKGKSKDHMMSYWDDGSWGADVFFSYKGKGKNMKGKMKPSANVYGMDLYSLQHVDFCDCHCDPVEPPVDFGVCHGDLVAFHELQPLELYSANDGGIVQRSVPPGYGMLDCGATASAGPEGSVKRLLGALRQHDPELQVSLNYQKRPFFRYGSGKWGQALYHMIVSSNLSEGRYFAMYVLENPKEFYENWFTDDMLVPILVGMDHLSKVGLVLDFSDGHAVNGNESPCPSYQLEKNSKGHYMVNIAQYLFGTVSESEAGNQQLAAETFAEVPNLGNQYMHGEDWFELAMMSQSMDCQVHVHETQHDRGHDGDRFSMFQQVVQRRLQINAASHSEAVGGQVPENIRALTNGPEEASSSSRSHQGEIGRSQRSPIMQQVMALLRQTRELGGKIQRLCPVEDMRSLCPEGLLHASTGVPWQECGLSRSIHSDQGLGTAEAGPDSSPESPQQEDGGDCHRDCRGHGSHLKSPPPIEGHGTPPAVSEAELSGYDQRRAVSFQVDSSERSGECVEHSDRCGEGAAQGSHQEASSYPGRGGCGAHLRDSSCSPMKDAAMIVGSEIEDVTKKGNFSLAYMTDGKHVPDEPYGNNPDLLDAACDEAAEIEFMMSFSESKTSVAQKTQKPKKKFARGKGVQRDVSFPLPTSSPASSTTADSRPLPWRIVKAAVAFMAMMSLMMQTHLRDFLRQDTVDGWEMFCSPDSWLTSAARAEGLRMNRINLHQGYDLYRPKTYELLKEKYKSERPKRIWISTRCTYWCPWTSLNYRTEEQKATLASRRRRERAMFKLLIPFILDLVEEDPDLELFWEWPTRCFGWQEPWLHRLEQRLRELGRSWLRARIDGCRYGLRSANGGFLQKSWTIGTTSEHFYHLYKAKTCPGCHEHERIQGLETQRSAFYPWRMCRSIAQSWRSELYPERFLQRLHAPMASMMTEEECLFSLGLCGDRHELLPSEQSASDMPSDPKVIDQWKVNMLKFHRAAGHTSNYNLARLLRDAGRPAWQVKAALDLHCDECAAAKLGGISSGKIPPASLRPLPKAWQCVGMDCTEWTPYQSKIKYTILVLMDLATKFKATRIILECGLSQQKTETADQILESFSQLWLQDKPKPMYLIPDNAKSMTSVKMKDVLAEMNIMLDPPAPKESWAHGLIERAVQEVKEVSTKIHMANPDLSSATCLALATNALNSTEYVQGYTPFQWVYGSQATLDDEEHAAFPIEPTESIGGDFTALLQRRKDAEDVARKVKADRTLNKLRNSKGKAQWLGPGRVVFHEVINGQHPQDERKHVVWVVVGGAMHRCSVHSVRKVTARERLDFELHSPEDPSRWTSLSDLIPKRSFVDVVPEEPLPEEEEIPEDLPMEPNEETMVHQPKFRHWHKSPPGEARGPAMPSIAEGHPEPVNSYDPSFIPTIDDDDEALGNAGLGSGIPTLEERSSSSRARLLDSESHAPSSEPDSKKARVDDDALLLQYLEVVEELYVLEFDLDLTTQKQKKQLMDNPSLFLAQKLRDCEVRLEKLKPEHRELFRRAKLKEVNSFISNKAVRRCEDALEEQEARDSGRLMRCRWVLTWKPTPDESLPEAEAEVLSKPGETTFTADGKKKAKARIVLLGFEHPDLLSEHYQTASPVQSVLTRNLSYQLVLQEGWEIEGLDLSTAFLQTLPTEESKKLWTTGVQELREALQLPTNGILRILKDFYGSTTAPRNLWKNIDGSLKALGAVRIVGDPCFWLWRVPLTDEDRKQLGPDQQKLEFKTLGFMAGHVDDFHRAGDLRDERWLQIRSQIDAMYKWGQLKKNEYRHAGTDLCMTMDPTFGRCLTIDQSYYIEMLEDVQVDSQRFSLTQVTMSDKEISACRAAIGALQWVAVQTQPLACARCNLLLSELAGQPTMRVAQEIQELIKELRKSSTVLKFFRVPKVNHWTQMVIVGLGDQAHQNRPKGGSTGGLLIFLNNQDLAIGQPAPMILVTWKTWKLKRVSIGTNDAEVQALVETEDVLFRTRMLWAAINSAGTVKPEERADFLHASEEEAKLVPGLLGTDSKGGYDSIMVNESPMLGLSNTRSAIQAFQLKESLPRCLTKLLWLASDWNLSDCMTKKKEECRKALLRSQIRALRHGKRVLVTVCVWLAVSLVKSLTFGNSFNQSLERVTTLKRISHRLISTLLSLVTALFFIGASLVVAMAHAVGFCLTRKERRFYLLDLGRLPELAQLLVQSALGISRLDQELLEERLQTLSPFDSGLLLKCISMLSVEVLPLDTESRWLRSSSRLTSRSASSLRNTTSLSPVSIARLQAGQSSEAVDSPSDSPHWHHHDIQGAVNLYLEEAINLEENTSDHHAEPMVEKYL